MLQYSSYYIGFFDYDMSYIVALFICLLFPSFQHWTYFTHRALCSPSSNPFILVKVREKGFNLRIVYDELENKAKEYDNSIIIDTSSDISVNKGIEKILKYIQQDKKI